MEEVGEKKEEKEEKGIVVYQRGPHSGLPSWRPSCLRVHALLSFQGLPFQVRNVDVIRNYELFTIIFKAEQNKTHDQNFFFLQNSGIAGGELPLVLWGDGTWVGDHEVLERALRKRLAKGSFLDDALLSEEQRDEGDVWRVFVDTSFRESLLASWWLDQKNSAVMEGLLVQGVPWPLNVGALSSLQRYLMSHLHPAKGDPVEGARKSLAMLNRKLGDKLFMLHESKPTSLDSVVFGYLCAALYVDVPSRRLAKLIVQHPALVRYVNRILEDYLHTPVATLVAPPPAPSQEEEEEAERKRKSAYPDGQEGEARGKSLMAVLTEYTMMGVVALGAVYIGYVVWTQQQHQQQQPHHG